MVEHYNFTTKGYKITRYGKGPKHKDVVLSVKDLKKINKVIKELQYNLGQKPTPEMTKYYVATAHHKLDKLVSYSLQ